MSTYTIYFSPSDWPGKYVARRFQLVAGEPQPRELMAVEATLEACRAVVRQGRPGLVRMVRDPSDEAQIVETWL
jgi:hypothetical protein